MFFNLSIGDLNMKKNVRDYKKTGKQCAYVLDAIINSENENATDEENINYFFKVFDDEFNIPYNKRVYPYIVDRLSQYLQGLPSCIAIAFSDYDIINIGKDWGCCKTDKQESRFVEYWFNTIAFILLDLKEKLNK